MNFLQQLVDKEIYISCDVHDVTSITCRVITYVGGNRLLAVIAYFLVLGESAGFICLPGWRWVQGTENDWQWGSTPLLMHWSICCLFDQTTTGPICKRSLLSTPDFGKTLLRSRLDAPETKVKCQYLFIFNWIWLNIFSEQFEMVPTCEHWDLQSCRLQAYD